MNPARLFAVAADVRDVIAAWYDDDAHDETLPARRFVTAGEPAADCELLAVAVEGMNPIAGTPAEQAIAVDFDETAYHMRAAALAVWILRCTPMLHDNGDPPTVDEEEEYSELVLRDPLIVENAIRDAIEAGELAGCGAVQFIDYAAVSPEGGLGGGVVRLAISLE